MANLEEKPEWTKGVYQLETTDAVMAGPNGVDNVQAKQLANRTQYLKQQVETNASKTTAGRVKLNSAVNSTSETEAATPSAVKLTYDLASSAQNTANTAKNDAAQAKRTADQSALVADTASKTATAAKSIAETNASKTTAGRVKLNSAVNSTSETEAATPRAVKMAYDLSNGAVKKTGDTMTGQLILPKEGIKINYDNNNIMALISSGDNFANVFFDAETKQWLSKLVYNSTANTWRFQYVNDVTINNKSVLKSGDYGIGSLTGAPTSNPNERLLSGWYGVRTSDFPDLPRNDSATLIVYGTGNPYFYVEQVAAVASTTPRIFNRCRTINGNQPWYETITTANINNFIPAGVPLPWPQNAPPSGWFECNGSSFDINKYPALAKAYPTGNLPDLRGVFIRGKDNGRGLDPSRPILSYQDDAIRNITGSVWPISETFGLNGGTGDGVFRAFDVVAGGTPTSTDRGKSGGFNFDASRVVPVAHENRPRNVAFIYIVKAE